MAGTVASTVGAEKQENRRGSRSQTARIRNKRLGYGVSGISDSEDSLDFAGFTAAGDAIIIGRALKSPAKAKSEEIGEPHGRSRDFPLTWTIRTAFDVTRNAVRRMFAVRTYEEKVA